MTTSTTDIPDVVADVEPPATPVPTKMKSHRYDVEVYADATRFAEADGMTMSYLLNAFLRNYVDAKRAEEAAANATPEEPNPFA